MTLDNTITNIKADAFELSFQRPWTMARGTTYTRSGFLIRCQDEAGEVGYGESSPLSGWTESYSSCQNAIQSVQERFQQLNIHELLPDLRNRPAARHGLIQAAMDLRARHEQHPLYQTMGATSDIASVPVNGTVSDSDPDQTASSVKQLMEQGFACVKIKVGARTTNEDYKRLEAISKLDQTPDLRLDANEAWSFEEAKYFLQKLDWFQINYVEQPLSRDNLEGHHRLRKYATIALDESTIPHAVDRIIKSKACDIAILKPIPHGGIDQVLSAARQYIRAGIDPVISNTVDSVVARTGAVHLAAALQIDRPCGLATGSWIEMDLAEDPAPVEHGRITVPKSNGLGISSIDPTSSLFQSHVQ